MFLGLSSFRGLLAYLAFWMSYPQGLPIWLLAVVIGVNDVHETQILEDAAAAVNAVICLLRHYVMNR
jgi:hypothetical protein